MAQATPSPSPGRPLRLAFVGQRTFFEACALDEDSERAVTTFVDFRHGADARAMRGALEAFAPDAVVVFRPEIVPAGLFEDLPAVTVGFLTEPIPRAPRGAHPDLARRRAELAAADPGNFDRTVAFDPLIVPTAGEVLPVWRAVPLPVADRFYAPVRTPAVPPVVAFVGRSTPHREAFLRAPKRALDLLHVAFGLHGDELDELLARTDVAINLHNEPYPSFENRVCLHLAAGHLVVSETLSPRHGLEPGRDYLEFSEPGELLEILRRAALEPDAYASVRAAGRETAESYRASTVWPAVLADCLADVAAHGRGRRRVRTPV